MVALELSPEELNALERESRIAGRSPADVVREAVLEWIEDQYDAREADRVMKEVRAGRMKTYSLEEVMAKHGLAPSDH